MSAYCVYVFLDDKNRPYYVGKTNNFKRRKREHEAEISKGNKLPKYNKARKLINNGIPFKMRTIKRVDEESIAYKFERHYINKYRNEGYVLLNCTAGGPLEKPIRINKPKTVKQAGILLPVKDRKIKKHKSSPRSKYSSRSIKNTKGVNNNNGAQYRKKH